MLREQKLDIKPVTGKHTARVILQEVVEVCVEWGLLHGQKYPLLVTSDQGANVKKALSEDARFGHVPCASHMLHNCVFYSVRDTKPVRDVLNKVCRIATNMHMSGKQKDAFESFHLIEYRSMPKKFITPVATRWHYYLLAAVRLAELTPAL